jgi:signal transduction histidine kinase
MSNARALSTSVLAMEQARRGKLIGISLLIFGLTLFTLAAVLLTPRLLVGEYSLRNDELLLLGGGAGWLIIAYIFRRLNHLNTAGILLVVLSLIALGGALYGWPSYQLALLPAAALPVGLAALLLSFQAVYIVALLAGVTAMLAWWLALGAPAPLPLEAALPVIGTLVALTVLALILAPLRKSVSLTLRLAQHADKNIAQAEQQIGTLQAQREADQERQQLERQHMRALIERIEDGVLFTDADGRIVQTNPVAQQLWAEVIGGDLDGRSAGAMLAALRERGEGQHSKSRRLQHIDLLSVPRNAAEQGMGASYILLDRREQARLARLRGELLELLADEMRNPLTSMLTALEMTLGQNLPDGADRVLVGARRSGQRLLELVNTLLEINQMEEAQDVLRRIPTALRSVIESGIAYTAPLAQKSSVHVVVEYVSDAVLPLDKDRLRRAFVNLLENALRQSPPYSTINVQSQRQGSAIVVRVTDQGPGLPIEDQRTMFEHLSGSADGRNVSALGLTFSKLVVEAHGGQIWVEESKGGQGSTFAFSLPLDGNKSA